MNRYFLLILSFLLTLGCKEHGDKYKFRDISEFSMQPNALKDNEPIKLIYTSQGPDYNREHDYYIQVVTISQVSGDTVNILTPIFNGFSPEDGDKTFNYISASNPSYALSQLNESELKNMTHIDSIKVPPKT